MVWMYWTSLTILIGAQVGRATRDVLIDNRAREMVEGDLARSYALAGGSASQAREPAPAGNCAATVRALAPQKALPPASACERA